MVAVTAVYSGVTFAIQSAIQPRVVGDAVGLSATLTFLSLGSGPGSSARSAQCWRNRSACSTKSPLVEADAARPVGAAAHLGPAGTTGPPEPPQPPADCSLSTRRTSTTRIECAMSPSRHEPAGFS